LQERGIPRAPQRRLVCLLHGLVQELIPGRSGQSENSAY
jgi:hypothetical protein